MLHKKRKICFLAATLGKGGAEKQAYYLLKTLRANGHELKLIYFEPEDSWKAPIVDLGVEVIRVADASKKARLIKAYRLIKQEKFDVIHALHYHINPYVGVLGLITGIKSVGAFRRDGEKELRTVNKHIMNATFRLITIFISNSKRAIEKLSTIRSLEGKLHYLPNIIELPDTSHSSNVGQPAKFLAVNSLVERKRVNRVLEFIARYKKQNPRVTLKILGDGPLRTELQCMVKTLKIESNVSFEGQIDDVSDYYRQADVLLLASESEGTPNVILEAMSYGKVIISSRVGEVDYLLKEGEYGLIADFESDQGLDDICARLSTDWGKLKDMGKKARHQIKEHYSYTHLYDNIKNIYQAL